MRLDYYDTVKTKPNTKHQITGRAVEINETTVTIRDPFTERTVIVPLHDVIKL